ncbi:hypothetical protein ACFU99_08330 [Streptomyces sp. NPDC057654]|uniref:hypothetical protein n=1 Tax=Streptomyces sp. NPDC057654 TaxID=3346196 RepID=UPI00369592AF
MAHRIQSVLRRTLARVTSLFTATTEGRSPDAPAAKPLGRPATGLGLGLGLADDLPLPYVAPVFAFSGIDIGPDGMRVRLTPVTERSATTGVAC